MSDDNTVDRAHEILHGVMRKQPIVLGIQDEMINHGGKYYRDSTARSTKISWRKKSDREWKWLIT